MGRKIFISYKYDDTSVARLSRTPLGTATKVRDYVDELQDKLAEEDHINKGELDGEDLSDFKDSTIASKLRDKIYDSSITVVLVSPQMKDFSLSEDEQWIPWEVSYSLREATRNDRTSRMNGVLAVVLPDINGSYDYVLEKRECCSGGCVLWRTDKLFNILRVNMFNRKNKVAQDCLIGENVYRGYASYIHMVEWSRFITNINHWINVADGIREDASNYDIHINV